MDSMARVQSGVNHILNNFMRDLYPALYCVIPVGIVYLSVFSNRMKSLAAQGLYSPCCREVLLFCYATLICSIIVLKLWPAVHRPYSNGVWADIYLMVGRPSWDTNVNLIPLGTFKDYSEWILLGTSSYKNIIINCIGNIGIFVLFGLLTPMLFRKVKFVKIIIFATLLSGLCEGMQYFLMRYVAADDVMLNVIGAIFGYGMYQYLYKRLPKLPEMLTMTRKITV